MATNPVQDYPLQSELGLINYLRSVTGTGSRGSVAVPGQVGQTQQAVAGQAPELTQDVLSNIMTEWLRGSGNFLQSMQQQNQSGLYNSSTRRLVANDLTAQAALKAAQAGSAVQQENARLATAASQTNANLASANRISDARYQTETSMANAARGVAGTSQKDQAINALLAAALNAYRGKEDKEAKSKKATRPEDRQAQGVEAPAVAPAPYSAFTSDDAGFAPMLPYEASQLNAPQMSYVPSALPQISYDMYAPQLAAQFEQGYTPQMSYDPAMSYTPIDYSAWEPSYAEPIAYQDWSGYSYDVNPNQSMDFTPIDYSGWTDYNYNDYSSNMSTDYTNPIDFSGW